MDNYMYICYMQAYDCTVRLLKRRQMLQIQWKPQEPNTTIFLVTPLNICRYTVDIIYAYMYRYTYV